MYDDIGKKIKILSKVLGILSAIGWFIIAIMNDWGVLLGMYKARCNIISTKQSFS